MKTQHAAQQQPFSVAHFRDFGERYGIDYRFPGMVEPVAHQTVVQGRVDEILLPSGMTVTCSDLQVIEPYESTSIGSSPLFMLVVLEGHVRLRLNGEAFCIRPGMSLATCVGKDLVLQACHQGSERLVTISLGIHPDHFNAQSPIAALVSAWQQKNHQSGIWSVPEHLLTGLRQAQPLDGNTVARQLMLEGLLLQLLAHQLLDAPLPDCHCQIASALQLPPGERHRLEQVRQLLKAEPEKNHTLDALASIAAMSPSSLRSKFRLLYGDSVFNYLRDCRLELARRYLREGHSVQQAAWMSGYQHATNFATAFRRRYGVAPSALSVA
ncbi:helix-turn-helix domain-containing protein [Erwinia sp. V71]|uniref:helix-turn-helix transcriptional regulator n=1 Tax=Erwinia sp. V71 TaxID=3369424 RepID=UPI003F60591F